LLKSEDQTTVFPAFEFDARRVELEMAVARDHDRTQRMGSPGGSQHGACVPAKPRCQRAPRYPFSFQRGAQDSDCGVARLVLVQRVCREAGRGRSRGRDPVALAAPLDPEDPGLDVSPEQTGMRHIGAAAEKEASFAANQFDRLGMERSVIVAERVSHVDRLPLGSALEGPGIRARTADRSCGMGMEMRFFDTQQRRERTQPVGA